MITCFHFFVFFSLSSHSDHRFDNRPRRRFCLSQRYINKSHWIDAQTICDPQDHSRYHRQCCLLEAKTGFVLIVHSETLEIFQFARPFWELCAIEWFLIRLVAAVARLTTGYAKCWEIKTMPAIVIETFEVNWNVIAFDWRFIEGLVDYVREVLWWCWCGALLTIESRLQMESRSRIFVELHSNLRPEVASAGAVSKLGGQHHWFGWRSKDRDDRLVGKVMTWGR